MARFKHLTVKGFRRLLDVDTELRPLTVLLGVNGVGKSSVLEAISLLSSSAEGRLKDRISEMGGLVSLMTIDKASRLTLGTKMEVAGDVPLEGPAVRLAQVPSRPPVERSRCQYQRV